MSTESVGSCASSSSSFLQPRKLFQDEPDHNPQTTPLEMNPPFSFPPQQEGHFRNTVSDSRTPSSGIGTSIPSDRAVFPMGIPQNTPGVVNYYPLSPQGQYGNYTMNRQTQTCQPTPVRSPQNTHYTPEAVKAPYTPEGYNRNKCFISGAGGSGPPDYQAMMTTNGEDVPKIECPCGSGTCIVLTSRTEKNPNRRFYKCPAEVKCSFFKWCDELSHSSQSPLKPSQRYTRSPCKIINPQITPLKPKGPICSCKAGECSIRTMHQGQYKGRKYYACAIKKGQGACDHFEWVDNPVKSPETENDLNGNQNISSIAHVTTPEQKETRPPYESVKDLFSENDMRNIDFWSQGQNAPNCVAETIVNEARRELSPGKRPPHPNTVGEISPMKRLNLSDTSPVVENCPTCAGIGQCVECPVLTCFKDDDFAEENHGNALDGYTISNMANILPVGGNTVDNTSTGCLRRVGKCFNCGKEGHWSSECTLYRGTNSACFKCGKVGHWMKNCNM